MLRTKWIQSQGCSGARETQRNAVPANILEPERRSGNLRLKCTKFDFGWGSAQTPLGSLQRPQTP